MFCFDRGVEFVKRAFCGAFRQNPAHFRQHAAVEVPDETEEFPVYLSRSARVRL